MPSNEHIRRRIGQQVDEVTLRFWFDGGDESLMELWLRFDEGHPIAFGCAGDGGILSSKGEMQAGPVVDYGEIRLRPEPRLAGERLLAVDVGADCLEMRTARWTILLTNVDDELELAIAEKEAHAARHREPALFLDDFADHILVRCPSCDARAEVRPAPRPDEGVRLTCRHCGHSARKSDRSCSISGAPVDSYFRLPLWLQAPCCGELLWAYNREQLDWLRGYVTAELRANPRDPEYGWRNKRLGSRLPKWLKLASNRTAILRTLDRLERDD